MRLFIAEKPTLGKAIADGLSADQRRADGYIECGVNVVTWCFGHFFEQADPDYYLPDNVPTNEKSGRKRWRIEDLPIMPPAGGWMKQAKPKTKSQLAIIRGLIKKADSVVNAGDPDREGQLLVDEILEDTGWRGPTKRIWLSATDPTTVARALANLRDNAEYVGLRDAAEARARADWLIGMNMTRAMTLRNAGSGVVSVGRVQTPTLALIVRRDEQIEQFEPHDFYVPQIVTAGFAASWKPTVTDTPDFDDEDRLINKMKADALTTAAKSAGTATVSAYKSERKRSTPPLGFSLSELQSQCSAKFGLGAQQVLDIAQALYETHHATSYPRSDCRYLPDEQHGDATGILDKLGQRFEFAHAADPARKSPAWNTGKVTAHHAIVPTGVLPSSLSQPENQVYDLIVRCYVAQFLPDYQYDAASVVLACADETWGANGRKTVAMGWRDLFGDKPKDAELPALTEGHEIPIVDARSEAKKTTPPKRFEEGSLPKILSNIHRFVEDEAARAKLKETSGIGTEATRAAIIEKLKERKFVENTKGKLVSTPAGRALIAALPDHLTNPVTTAQWEDVLSDIAAGQATLAQFEAAQREQVVRLVEQAKSMQVQIGEARAHGGGNTSRKPAAGPVCPDCRTPTIKLKTKTSKTFYKCEACRSCWWPGFKNAKALGKKWENR